MRHLLLSVSAFLLLLGNVVAQQHRECGATEVLARQLLEDPLMQQRMQEIEDQTAQFIQEGGAQERVVVTIPVVVHVVWNTSTENISDAQIQSQLDVLNADFRKLNSDIGNVPAGFSSLAADAEINFCLATQTATGAATTGIVRVQTTVTSFSTNDAVKFTAQGGSNAWDRNKYLNIWVCDLGGGLLGYAQFPGGSASTDGVVCDYAYFGTIGTATAPFNKGRTATHEVGHWLNLYHIWGDDGTSCSGSDNCADTPNQADENYGCPSFPQISCSNSPNGDMFMNYMDYTDDACMFMFTTGQKNRMQALFGAGGARVSLTSSTGCNPPTGGSCGTPSGLSATGITQTSATLSWGAVSGATSYTLQWKLASSSTWNTVNSLTSTSYNLTGLTAGTSYNFQVRATCSSTTGSYSSASTFTTSTTPGCGIPGSLNATNLTTTGATLNWGAVSGATSYTLQWKLASATTWNTVNSLTGTSYNLTGLTAGTSYNFQMRATCGSTTGSYSAPVTFTTATAGCTDNYEPNNTRTQAKVIPVNTNVNALIGTSTDVDWLRFSNTSSQRRIKIDLTNLPADYDVQLYRNSTLLGTSENAGTAAEQIIYNTTTVSNAYYAYVYGWSGAFSASQCYTIRVSLSSSNWRTDGTTDGSVEELELPVVFENAGFGLFPNPASSEVTVEVPLAQTEMETTVALFDASGRLTLQQQHLVTKGDNRITLSLGDVPTGVYFVKVSNGEISKTRKLVVNH